MNIPDPTISFVTENGILLEFATSKPRNVSHALQQHLCSLARRLREHSHAGPLLCDIVTAPGSLLLLLHDGRTARRLLRHTETLWRSSQRQQPSTAAPIEIPVQYGGVHGPDLEPAAAACGISAQQFIQRHLEGDYYVHNLGFMPGFAYLGGLDPCLHLPRKHTPALRVPAGSVAIGGSHTGIYPAESPGGWHVIGFSTSTLFDPFNDQPCLLQPGDRVRFVQETRRP